MRKKLSIILAMALFSGSILSAQEIPLYLDEKAPARDRAADLISRLTLDEKSSMLWGISPAVQRLGIHSYAWWSECLHGIAGRGTVYPTPIGMAASFDDVLVYQIFCSISDEARARFNELNAASAPWENKAINSGVNFFCPNINIVRDPRWGRGMESYGEDPYLVGKMGVAVVNGLQGVPGRDSLKVLACAKHYAVHSGPEPIRHEFDVDVSERDLRETYLPAFKDLAVKSKVGSIMFAYNAFRGKPCGASEYLLKDILIGEWGYKGIILSDCAAVEDVWAKHKYVKTPEEACAAVIKAGSNLECGWTFGALANAVRGGLLKESELDESLMKVLSARFRLGVMDQQYKYADMNEGIICCAEHSAQALQIARESIVLLQNRNCILPLSKDEKIAVVGPNADNASMHWGNYNGFPKEEISFLDALKGRFPDIRYIRGCELAVPTNDSGEKKETFAARYNTGTDASFSTESSSPANQDVLAQLEGIETIIFAGGLSPRLEGEEMNVAVEGFSGGDRTSIELPSCQRELIASLAKAGKKVIFVCFSGSAIAMAPEVENCQAILQAWYPGQEGGAAVTDVLLGDYNPSGKLPVSIYASDKQLTRDFTDYSMEGRTYRYMKEKPLFPFGFGLSYTSFAYSNLKYHNSRGRKWVSFKVTNTGNKAGTDVAQLYISRPDDADGPVRTLRSFKRITLKAGESADLKMELSDSTFEWWNPATSRMEAQKGKYVLYLGPSSNESQLMRTEARF